MTFNFSQISFALVEMSLETCKHDEMCVINEMNSNIKFSSVFLCFCLVSLVRSVDSHEYDELVREDSTCMRMMMEIELDDE